MSEDTPLQHRIDKLEAEISRLRQRMDQLDGGPATQPQPQTEPPPMMKKEETPSAPEPEPVTPPATPPPIPTLPPLSPLTETTEPAEPPRPSALRELLGTLQLLPPESGHRDEAQIGGWWATRIGALLAVIGVVFFGIYLSAHATPLVRWLELAAIAVGATLGGFWLERRELKIGPVITGSGLALIFYAAFAAYAVPAVKIISDPVPAALLQAGAVALVAGVAWRRRSSTTATMAVLMGFVSAYFSMELGFPIATALAGLAMAGLALSFYFGHGWTKGLYLSVVLGPLLILINNVADGWIGGSSRLLIGYLLIGANFVLHLCALWRERRTEVFSATQHRLQAINTALCLFIGWLATVIHHGQDAYAAYFFTTGLLLTVLTLGLWRIAPRDTLFTMFAVKAASLLALGVISHWEARTRWIALLVEAFVLLAAAQRTQRVALRVTSIFVYVVSLLFYHSHLSEFGGDWTLSFGLAVLGYLLASVAYFGWVARQSEANAADTLAWGLAPLLPLGHAILILFSTAWAGLALIVGAALLAGAAQRRGLRVAWPAAGLAYVGAFAVTLYQAAEPLNMTWLWAGALPLAGLSLFAGWRANRDDAKSGSSRQLLATLLPTLGLLALCRVITPLLPAYPAFLAASVLAVGLSLLGRQLRHSGFALAGMINWALTGFLLLQSTASSEPGNVWFAAIALLGGPCLWIIGRDDSAEDTRVYTTLHWIIAAVLLPLIWDLAQHHLLLNEQILLVLGGGALAAGIGRHWHCGAAYTAATALGGLVVQEVLLSLNWVGYEGAYVTLSLVAVLSFSLAALPLYAVREASWIATKTAQLWRVLMVGVAAVMLSRVATIESARWSDYGSVLWALGGIALFVLGLVGRARSHRITGLLMLAFCIPRVFVHDIQEAKYRIAAFIGLGLLLLWVGFSYQKFRHLVTNDEEESPKS